MTYRRSLRAPHSTLHALLHSIVVTSLCATVVSAQLIPIKTLPIAQSDQFNFFPSANQAMGGVSLAVSDSLLDPFINPAKGARLRSGAMQFFGAPTFYSISRAAGGGQTLPVGGLMSNGSLFGGAVFAMQEMNPSRADANLFDQQNVAPPPGVFGFAPTPLPAPEQGRNKYNRFAFATLGRRVTNGFSVGGSLLYADLHRIDGVDQLYAGSQSVNQFGGDLDARLGVVRDWQNGSTLEALIVHDRLSMTHDVTFAETFYDPNVRFVSIRPRVERNLDRTNTWGMHMAWQRPVGDSGWRVGASVTGNLLAHPKLPDFQIVDAVRPVPWDPGHSAAYNFGIGISQHQGPSTFALDFIYEPIFTHTWGEAPTELQTVTGSLVPAGGRTTENHFTFSNILARVGFGQDIPIQGARYPLRLQGGISAHSIHYWLDQDDHIELTSRRQYEQWVEWSPTWGASMRFGGVELRYTGSTTHGTGRPGLIQQFAQPNIVADAGAFGSSPILAAPSGPLTLTPVSITSHQLSIAVPLP